MAIKLQSIFSSEKCYQNIKGPDTTEDDELELTSLV